jgi:hypothetical protein
MMRCTRNVDRILSKNLLGIKHMQDGSRESSVGIANGYGLDDRGVGVRVPIW